MSEHDTDFDALTAALGGLSPTPPSINRDRLLFQAGRQSMQSRTSWIWPSATGVFATLSIVLGVMLAGNGREAATQMVRNVGKPAEPAPVIANEKPARIVPLPQDMPRTQNGGYLRLRDQVVRFGVESLPTVTANHAEPSSSIEPKFGLPAGAISDWQKTHWQSQHFRGGV